MATPLQSYFTPMPSFGGAEYLNRQQWASMPKTADMNVLNQTYLRSKAAHDALMKAQAMEAEQDNQILNTATPDELANLFGPPRTPREARLQKIVQGDVRAKDFGVRLIGTPKERMDYQQSIANLDRTNLQNYLDPMRFQLDEARFGETVNQNDFNRYNQMAQRQHAANQLASQNQFRTVQAQNAEANRLQRERLNQVNLGARTQESELNRMLQMERMLQDRANAEQRQQNFQTGADRGYFQDVARAAERGALPPAQLSQFASRFDPATLGILQGYANVAQQNGFGPQTEGDTQPGFLSRLASRLNPFATDPASADQWQNDSGYADDGSEDFGMGNDFAAPAPTMTARPAAPVQAPQQRRAFIPGSQVRDPRTGQKFLVLPNGQFRPI